jgi:hypothetical protein
MHSDLSLSVISHDRLVDTFQHLGSRFTSTFVDGGIHPRFGTRNFILPLQNGHYLEVVCPLDHPSTGGKAIAKIVKSEVSGHESRIEEWLGSELRAPLDSAIEAEWVEAAAIDGESGIVAVHVMTPKGVVRLD